MTASTTGRDIIEDESTSSDQAGLRPQHQCIKKTKKPINCILPPLPRSETETDKSFMDISKSDMFFWGAVREVPARKSQREHGRKNTTGSHSIRIQLDVLLTSEFFSSSFSPAALLPSPVWGIKAGGGCQWFVFSTGAECQWTVSSETRPVLFFSTLKEPHCSFCKRGYRAVWAEHTLKLQNRYEKGVILFLGKPECWISGTPV